MLVIMLTVSLAALLVTAAIALLLRTFFTTHVAAFEEEAMSWRDYRPLQRLLDPGDFEFLRSRGVAEGKIRKLRKERRQIYRLCLRSLAADFHKVERSLNLVLIQSQADRPDLATAIGRQKVLFYRNLLHVEASLMVNACGIDHMPAVDLLRPLVAVQDQLRQLASTSVLVGSAA